MLNLSRYLLAFVAYLTFHNDVNDYERNRLLHKIVEANLSKSPSAQLRPMKKINDSMNL